MQIIRGLRQLRPHYQGCVATIGNFDGVHLGHRALFRQLAAKSHQYALPTTAILFEPQPLEFFAAEQAPARLSRFREKIIELQRLGVERVLCLRFDAEMVHMPASTFIQRVLVEGLGVKYLIVGDDFRFGYRREGDFATLQQAGMVYDFEVRDTPTHSLEGQRVSSTLVREALAEGKMGLAERLLGRPYRLSGRVAHGDKRGRTIGFPTANIFLHRRASPVNGVFAVTMHGVAAAPVAGVANLGTRPTVNGNRLQLEVHLFDFDADIYGRHVEVEFVHKLRVERKFDSFDQLRQQIELDAAQARQYLLGTEEGGGTDNTVKRCYP